MTTLIKDLIDLPERVQCGDFVPQLAESSDIMFSLLRDRLVQAGSLQASMEKMAGTTDDKGSHGVEVLELAEHVARELVEEVAEWSVIYAKDVTDT